jgi:hypothetical protein
MSKKKHRGDDKIHSWRRVPVTAKNENELPSFDLCPNKFVPCDGTNDKRPIDDKAYRMEIALKVLKMQFDRMMKFVQTGNMPSHDEPKTEEIEISANDINASSEKLDKESSLLFVRNLEQGLKELKKATRKSKPTKCGCSQRPKLKGIRKHALDK